MVVTVLVNMAGGTPGSFVYAPIRTPVALNANAEYYVISLETVNGDQWYSNTTKLATTDVATITNSVFGDGTTYTKGPAGTTFGPLDFLYL
jgi:hypothetical protein